MKDETEGSYKLSVQKILCKLASLRNARLLLHVASVVISVALTLKLVVGT